MDDALETFRSAFGALDPMRFRNWAQTGLTTAQMRALALVYENPGVTIGELATSLALTPSSISGLVDRLVRSGLIRRERDIVDRRKVRNFLTDEGTRAREDAIKVGERFLLGIFSRMDPVALASLIHGQREFVRAAANLMAEAPELAGPDSSF